MTDTHDTVAAMVAALSRHEAWRYTKLSPLVAALGAEWWQPADQVADSHTPAPEFDAIPLDGTCDLPAISRQRQATPEGGHDAPFTAQLNRLFARQTTAIRLTDGSHPEQPLLLIQRADGGACYHRHTLEIGAQSAVTLIELFDSGRSEAALCSSHLQITLQPGARLTHYRIQQQAASHHHLGSLQIEQQRDSHYRLHAIELGGGLSRLDLTIHLQQPGAECDLNGLFVLAGTQHADHHLTIDHAAPHCRSRAEYRTVLDGRSHGVFNGKVVVQPGAIRTDSAQHSANLLLSKRAQIDTKPELEIYNDDVQCAHGATVGQLDDEQLFYLRSRGVSEDGARTMLITAFAEAVIMGIRHDPLRQRVEQAVLSKLNNG